MQEKQWKEGKYKDMKAVDRSNVEGKREKKEKERQMFKGKGGGNEVKRLRKEEGRTKEVVKEG